MATPPVPFVGGSLYKPNLELSPFHPIIYKKYKKKVNDEEGEEGEGTTISKVT